MNHECPICHLEHEAVDLAPVAETVVEADAVVRVAEIEADRDIKLAKIGAEAVDTEDAVTLAHLRGRLDGIEETLARLAAPAPEPEPVPIVVEPDPEPEPVVDVVDAPPVVEPATTKRKGSYNPFFG